MATIKRNDLSISVVAPSGGATAGAVAQIGNLIGVYVGSASAGERVAYCIKGRIEGVAKEAGTGLAWAQGAKLHYHATNGFTVTAAGAATIVQGIAAAESATDGATTGSIELL